MYIAQKKRKESIVEYILYMWNVEDLIRANGLDMKRISESVISKYGVTDPGESQKLYDWWDNLCEMMKREHKEEGGHLQILDMLANDIYNFHLYLLTQPSEIPYQNAFQTAWPDISLLTTKIKGGDKMHHVALCLTAIYDYYLLKLQGKTVLADTTNAIVRISHFLSILSQKYLKAERELHPEREVSDDGDYVAPAK
ncbi:MAG: DUF4924 family protein [Marinilabiliaceae bacterium]